MYNYLACTNIERFEKNKINLPRIFNVIKSKNLNLLLWINLTLYVPASACSTGWILNEQLRYLSPINWIRGSFFPLVLSEDMTPRCWRALKWAQITSITLRLLAWENEQWTTTGEPPTAQKFFWRSSTFNRLQRTPGKYRRFQLRKSLAFYSNCTRCRCLAYQSATAAAVSMSSSNVQCACLQSQLRQSIKLVLDSAFHIVIKLPVLERETSWVIITKFTTFAVMQHHRLRAPSLLFFSCIFCMTGGN